MREEGESACSYLERCLAPDMRNIWYEACSEIKEKQKEQKPAEWSDSVAKGMFIKALERAVEQTKSGYELTDCDKNSWWEDFKAYSEIKPAEWSDKDKNAVNNLVAICTAAKTYRNFAGCRPEEITELQNWLKDLEQMK